MPHNQIYLCLNTFTLQQEKTLPLDAEQNSTEWRKMLPFQAELYLGRAWGAELAPSESCAGSSEGTAAPCAGIHSEGFPKQELRFTWEMQVVLYSKLQGKKPAQFSFLSITLPYNCILTLFYFVPLVSSLHYSPKKHFTLKCRSHSETQ